MLTLKHFMDRPTWAAAAGYDFNYLDCMSVTAAFQSQHFSTFVHTLVHFPDVLVIELPVWLLALITSFALAIAWPFIFWLAAIPLWLRCTWMQWKYQDGNGMTEIAKGNLAGWIERVDKDK